jgi:hypothetical protein
MVSRNEASGNDVIRVGGAMKPGGTGIRAQSSPQVGPAPAILVISHLREPCDGLCLKSPPELRGQQIEIYHYSIGL